MPQSRVACHSIEQSIYNTGTRMISIIACSFISDKTMFSLKKMIYTLTLEQVSLKITQSRE